MSTIGSNIVLQRGMPHAAPLSFVRHIAKGTNMLLTRKVFTLLLGLFLLSSCATDRVILLSKTPVDINNRGVALLSLGYSGKISPFQVYWIEFQSTNKASETIQFVSSPGNNMFSSGKTTVSSIAGRGEVVAHQLPPGEYKITRVGAFSDTGPWSGGGIKRPPLVDLSFSIKAGEVTYLGSAMLLRHSGLPFKYAVLDEFDRDIAIFRAIRPELDSLHVRKSLLTSEFKN